MKCNDCSEKLEEIESEEFGLLLYCPSCHQVKGTSNSFDVLIDNPPLSSDDYPYYSESEKGVEEEPFIHHKFEKKRVESEIKRNVETYGYCAMCKDCPDREKCGMPYVPGLIKVVCKKDPEFEKYRDLYED